MGEKSGLLMLREIENFEARSVLVVRPLTIFVGDKTLLPNISLYIGHHIRYLQKEFEDTRGDLYTLS